jgi:long-subunit fatty acid transport protein
MRDAVRHRNLNRQELSLRPICSHVVWLVLVSLVLGKPLSSTAEVVTINTPGGPIEINLSHAGPEGSLIRPGDPSPLAFRPPSIFSAPLPSGSGARALGLAGAFTAVADDATAASWNPAGLIQLERPEASFMLRYSRHEGNHFSEQENYKVGSDSYENANLNYLSAVLPFRAFDHNWVFSLNYQEAYDFEQQFHAEDLQQSQRAAHQNRESVYTDTQVQHFDDGVLELTITSVLETHVFSQLDQILASDLTTDIAFRQEGIIDAVSPAMALELMPGLSVGCALNLYQDDLFGYRPIRSETTAHYTGNSLSRSHTTDNRYTEGTYTYNGTWSPVIEIMPGVFITNHVPISGSGTYKPFSDSESRGGSTDWTYEGDYTEENEFSNLNGWNATFGALWTANRHLSLGLTVDLPWTAQAEQRKTISNRVITRDRSGRIIDITEYSSSVSKDVEFDFPLYAAIGMVWKWNNALSSSLDISQTRWSDFAYQADGEPKINPLDGSPHGENDLDDCWAVRLGTEYIWALAQTEIPFRCGFSWEQRPAIGTPDEFYGVSAGSGISLGKDPGKLIIDVAYNYSWGNDVLKSLVPDQEGLSTDMQEHQVFVSCIYHF